MSACTYVTREREAYLLPLKFILYSRLVYRSDFFVCLKEEGNAHSAFIIVLFCSTMLPNKNHHHSDLIQAKAVNSAFQTVIHHSLVPIITRQNGTRNSIKKSNKQKPTVRKSPNESFCLHTPYHTLYNKH